MLLSFDAENTEGPSQDISMAESQSPDSYPFVSGYCTFHRKDFRMLWLLVFRSAYILEVEFLPHPLSCPQDSAP